MASSNNNAVISVVKPHTVKKFELVEAYSNAWAHKLLEYGRSSGKCNGIVFIDCMCNSGMYQDIDGSLIEGTPIRVAKVIAATMREKPYQRQQAWLYFNDIDEKKIEELKKHLPEDTHNFHIETSVGDGNELLHKIGSHLSYGQKINYLVMYDPYTASIDWTALMPFIQNWGEVIINHMVSDSIRAVGQVKKPEAISKYEQTYLSSIEELLEFGSDRTAYEQRIEKIVRALRGNSKYRYYIATCPFFNTKNSLVYDLIHCTTNSVGFNLYKKTAWQTFGGKSSLKNTHGEEAQMMFDFSGEGLIKTTTDDYCYYIKDIAGYLQEKFKGKTDVKYSELWDLLAEHPVFPADGFNKQIRDELKKNYGAKTSRSTISFSDGSYSI